MEWYKNEISRDAKISNLIEKFGIQGYGLYWYCMKIIAVPIKDYNFDIAHDAELLAYQLHMDVRQVEAILVYITDVGLFDDGEVFTTFFKLMAGNGGNSNGIT